MVVELKVPNLGESIQEAFITKWLKSPGEMVQADEPVAELESDKATVELPAPNAGVLTEILKQVGASARVGEVIAIIDDAAKAGQAKPAKTEQPKPNEEKSAPAKADHEARRREERPKGEPRRAAARQPEGTPPAPAQPETPPAEPVKPAEPASMADAAPPELIMPAAQRLLREAGIKPEEVQATGPGGRLLKEDVERHLDQKRREQQAARQAVAPERTGEREDQVLPMTPMRRTIAQRLVQAQQTAALLTTFNEIDMTAVGELRDRHRDAFQERHGVKLGLMSFFVKAAIDALRIFPQVNAEVRDTDIVYHNYYDIGIAIGTGGKGLVVPVLRNADKLGFAAIEQAIADFGKRARENKIELEELRGGTFTITNGGFYGSLLSTPVVNPPQSGILGMHAIQDRPVARGGQVVIRPMMYVALTYDHRIVDGREAVTFLRRVKECIEEPARLLMEI